MNWKNEIQKCKDDPRYFYNNYCRINGQKVTWISKEEWNAIKEVLESHANANFIIKKRTGLSYAAKLKEDGNK